MRSIGKIRQPSLRTGADKAEHSNPIHHYQAEHVGRQVLRLGARFGGSDCRNLFATSCSAVKVTCYDWCIDGTLDAAIATVDLLADSNAQTHLHFSNQVFESGKAPSCLRLTQDHVDSISIFSKLALS